MPPPQLADYIRSAKATDVILGRGSRLSEREGNKIFRKVAREYTESYASANSRAEKDRIVQRVLNEFRDVSSNGRFLRPISAETEAGDLVEVYEEVSNKVTITKIKQRLRDFAVSHQEEVLQQMKQAKLATAATTTTPKSLLDLNLLLQQQQQQQQQPQPNLSLLQAMAQLPPHQIMPQQQLPQDPQQQQLLLLQQQQQQQFRASANILDRSLGSVLGYGRLSL